MFSQTPYEGEANCKCRDALDVLEKLSQGAAPFETRINTTEEAKSIMLQGNLLFIGLKNSEIIIYNIDLKETFRSFKTSEEWLAAMTIDKSTSTLITVRYSSLIEFWTFEGIFKSKLDKKHNYRISNILSINETIYYSDIEGNLISENDNHCIMVKAHDAKIACLETNNIIASGGHDCYIKIWDLKLKLQGSLKSTKIIHRICFISDIKLASAGTKSLFCIWNIFNFTLDHIVESEDNWIRCLALVPNNDMIIVGTNDSSVRYWSLTGEPNEAEESFLAHENSITNICLNESGSKVITSSKDRTVKIWQISLDLPDNKQLKHNDTVLCLLVVDDLFIYSGLADGTICKWEIDTYELITAINAHTLPISALNNIEKDIISISEDKFLKVWKNDLIYKAINLSEYLMSLCINEKYIFVGTRNGSIHIFDKLYKLIKVLTGHWNSVSSIIWMDNMLFTASYDRNINTWDLDTFKLIYSFKAHDSGVRKILMHPCKSIIISIGVDKLIKIWHKGYPPLGIPLYGHDSSINAIAFSSDQKNFFTGDKNGNLLLWCCAEFVSVATFHYADPINDIAYVTRGRKTLVAHGNAICIVNDIISEKKIMTFPNSQSFIFCRYISNLVHGKTMPFKSIFKDYIIIPYRINVLHAMAFINDHQGIKEALKCGTKFLSTNGANPLRIALDRGSYQSADVILKYIPSLRKTSNPYIFASIENEFVDLLELYLKNLPALLIESFPVIKFKGLPAFGELKCKKMILSTTMNINPDDFGIKEGAINAIEFHECYFRLPLEVGSTDCINLLLSIIKCENSDVFDTLLIQTILEYLFSKASPVLILMALINLLSILFLLFYSSSLQHLQIFTILIIIINLFNLFTEALQMIQNFEYYITDVWNVIDSARIITIFLALFLILDGSYPEAARNSLSIAILFSMIRMISLFRLFSGTRYMIRIIFQVLQDISSFLLVLLMTTLAVSVSFYFGSKNANSGNFKDVFIYSYLMNFGQFDSSDLENENWYMWGLFLFALFLNPLVMMNLLIATMGDTYSRVQSNIVISNYKEIASLVLEACTLLIWKRSSNEKKYLQSCRLKENASDTGSISMKLKKMKNEIDRISQISLSNSHKLDQILNKIGNINK